MNIDILKEFVAICEYGGFEIAADELYTTQSSISKHIKKAEDELGVMLFDRSNRKVELTESGKLLLPYAQQIINLESEYLSELKKNSAQGNNILNVGSVYDTSSYGISQLLAKFKALNPDIQINLSCEGPFLVAKHIKNGFFDLAFYRYSNSSDVSDFTVIPYTTDKLVAVCNQSNALANHSNITLKELLGFKVLGFPENTFLNTFTREIFAAANIQPEISMVAQRTENLVVLASYGLGIATIFKKPAQQADTPGIAIIDIDPGYHCHIDLCYLKNAKLSYAAKKFIKFVASENFSD